MIKEIKYEGYTEVPSDYECPDGDLALAQGVLPDEGTLQPILPATDLAILPAGYKIVFIHATSQMKHYIVHRPSTGAFYWIDRSVIDNAQSHPVTITTSQLQLVSSFTSTDYNSINAVGNTLMVMDDEGIHYHLWKPSATPPAYINLGTHLPELPIRFSLDVEIERTDLYERDFNPPLTFVSGQYSDFDTDSQERISNEVMGKANVFIQEKANDRGKFMYPFLVRYAYRLYDQKLTMHSAPVLMVCSTNSAPLAGYRATYSSQTGISKIEYRMFAAVHTLVYQILQRQGSSISDLQNWGDIVKSIDIFVSAPIYTYDQSGKIKRLSQYDSTSYCIAKDNGSDAQKFSITELYREKYPDDTIASTRSLDLPRFDPDAIKEKICSTHDFYLLKSINVNNLEAGSWKSVDISANYLDSLVGREVMTNDYDSHDKLFPQYSYNYNSRLNIANMHKELFKGFGLAEMASSEDSGTIANWTSYAYIRQDGKEIVVSSPSSSLSSLSWPLMVFYPNPNAYKIILRCVYTDPTTSITVTEFGEYPLEQHDFLRGSFFFSGWDGTPVAPTSLPSTTDDNAVNMPNVIYTSEVNNPFLFYSSGVNTVGIGEIHGIASAVRPLSEGQFGEYPLYAFTTEGVWALEFRPDGVFVARQPVTRDVVKKPGVSITSIDTSVLFATDRGIMLMQGRKSKCISEELERENPFNLLQIRNGAVVYPGAAALANIAQVSSDSITLPNIKEFVKDCRMLYDYKNQRVLVYSPSDKCILVYNLKTGKWGMMNGTITSGINSYPEALAMTQSGTSIRLTDFSELATSATTQGLIVTRPLKLDYPNDLKTIRNIIQRGKFVKGHVGQVLWGSRDLINWHLVGSSVDHYLHNITGTPYKYFRLGLPIDMVEGENLYGCTVEYELKETNRIR